LAAEVKPDFSGEYVLNRPASTLSAIVAPVAQSGVLRIEHHEPKFTAHQTIVLDGKPFESNFELLSDRVHPALGRGRVSGHVANPRSRR